MIRPFLTALVAVAALSGCGTVFSPAGQIPVSQSLSPAAQQAQSAINESNVLLTAAANVIAQNFADGVTTREEARAQIAKVKGYAADVDRAKRLLDSGDIAGAQTQAELTRKLILILHREVAAKAREAK